MDIAEKISAELNIKKTQTEAAIRLMDEGATIPFIARYRKEATGALNDEVLRNLSLRLTYLRKLDERRESILSAIEEQGKLTPSLREEIEGAETAVVLEDLYRPYVKKRRTRAMIARERGLEPLAVYLLSPNGTDPLGKSRAFVNAEKEVPDTAHALAGAEDIIAETVSDVSGFRSWIRGRTMKAGSITSSRNQHKEKKEDYANYYDYSEALKSIPSHRVLALNRGEREKVLSVRIDAPEEEILAFLNRNMTAHAARESVPYVEEAVADAWKRLIRPSIENEIRTALTSKAEDEAIGVFGANLKQLLMQPPLAGRTVLGWDPAFRTGCKLCVVDPTGKVLDTAVVYPTAPQNKVVEAMRKVDELVQKYHVDVISLGNGTASRESEQIIADYIRTSGRKLQYVIVNEAGASVYSASALATEEFPQFDVGQRSSCSMARRLQDPLAELVKIDPKSVGVGQYQHDMNQAKLDEKLGAVVEECVNKVGVDLNTASFSLLEYVSGISKALAKNIVSYREENGSFHTRRELLKVPKLGPKAYEQCAGFLRIRGGEEPLDETSVHPESYESARKILTLAGFRPDDIRAGKTREIGKILKRKLQDGTFRSEEDLAEKIGTGVYTLEDIVKELEKPGRDPRSDVPKPLLRSDVLSIEDLKEGMTLKGTVRNIVDFGAFIDIGVHQDGLVHVSELSDRFVKRPLDVVSVGDIVNVRVKSVDPVRKKIALSMKGVPQG